MNLSYLLASSKSNCPCAPAHPDRGFWKRVAARAHRRSAKAEVVAQLGDAMPHRIAAEVELDARALLPVVELGGDRNTRVVVVQPQRVASVRGDRRDMKIVAIRTRRSRLATAQAPDYRLAA